MLLLDILKLPKSITPSMNLQIDTQISWLKSSFIDYLYNGVNVCDILFLICITSTMCILEDRNMWTLALEVTE